MNTLAQIVQHLRPGGIETLSLDLSAFANAGQNNLIVSLEGDIESAIKAWPRLAAYRDRLLFLDKQPGLRPSVVLKLVRLFKKHQVDCVHTHHIGPLLYGGLAARMANITSLIHTEHDAWHLNNAKRRQLQKMAMQALQPILVADARTVAQNMQKHLGKLGPINIIANGIDTQYFVPGEQLLARAQLNLPAGVQLIGCAGRMEKVKGQDVLINALARLPESIHLALAGCGSTEGDLRALVATLKLTDRVHFLGRIDNMPVFYQALDVFCLPSRNEGFPLCSLEAQSCNIRALVTDVGGSRETLCPDTGQWVQPNNSQTMADALTQILCSTTSFMPRAYVQKHGDIRLMVSAYANLRNTLPNTLGNTSGNTLRNTSGNTSGNKGA